MSAEVDVVRHAFELWGSQGPEAAMAALADESIEWSVRPDLPDADVYRGYDGLRRLLENFADSFAEQEYHPLDFIEVGGGRVVVPLRWSARGKASGAGGTSGEEAWVWTVRDGKVVRVDEYPTRADALEAVGAGGSD